MRSAGQVAYEKLCEKYPNANDWKNLQPSKQQEWEEIALAVIDNFMQSVSNAKKVS